MATPSAPPNPNSFLMSQNHSFQGTLGEIPEQQSWGWYGPAPAPSPNSMAVPSLVPIPPSMWNSHMMSNHPQRARGTRTKQTLPGIAIPHLVPEGNPSQPDPVKDLSSTYQSWRRQEAEWFQSKVKQTEALRARFCRALQESEDVWYQRCQEGFERCEKKNQEILEISCENERLIVGSSSPLGFLLFLTGIQAAVLSGKIEIMKLRERFNLTGALGRESQPLLI